jgi:hypothetical protein
MSFDLKTLASAVAGFAPTLASMLGGPFAGMAVASLESAFGLKSGAGPQAITDVIASGSMTPETLAAVRAADQRHAEIMGQQGIDLAKLNADREQAFAQVDAADRDSARQMQTKVYSPWPGVLSALTTVAVILELVVRHIPGIQSPQDPVTAQLIGTLQAAWVACLTYWVGSTRQGAANQNALAEIAKAP